MAWLQLIDWQAPDFGKDVLDKCVNPLLGVLFISPTRFHLGMNLCGSLLEGWDLQLCSFGGFERQGILPVSDLLSHLSSQFSGSGNADLWIAA